jgi:hypothetical protein
LSNWGYVTIAYTIVWGSLAVYALVLARRVAQARSTVVKLRETAETVRRAAEDDAWDDRSAR